MDAFASELQTEFKVQLENPHVISPSQVFYFFFNARTQKL